MCLDYNKIEIETIKRKIVGKVTDLSKTIFRIDPLLEDLPQVSRSASALQSIKISHGSWIEQSLKVFIRAIPGWESEINVKLSVKGKITEIDNIAYNSSTNTVVLWECKRQWETLDNDKVNIVSQRFKFLETHKTQLEAEILRNIGIKPKTIDMVVFNCWGKSKDWPKDVKEYTIYCRDEIGQLFGPCLWECIQFHKEYIIHTMSDLLGLEKNNNLEGNPFFKSL